MATNGSFAHQEQYKVSAESYNAAPASIDPSNASDSNNDLSKDEVGWYFVEQYYTTLSKSPEKLHLFYGKRSQFVSGIEAEVANVSVGRQAIQERIKKLDFQECKVRVSNVDSQASFDSIVIQVIGEISNKASEPKKFVQTFVLAQQPSGYFVLNDMLRYIDEEGEDEQNEAADASVEEPKTDAPASLEADTDATVETAADDSTELDTAAVSQKLEEAPSAAPVDDRNGTVNEEPEAEEAAPVESDIPVINAETTAQEIAEEDVKEAEKPKDPTPTPIATNEAAPVELAPAEPTPAEPAAAPKPMTWASRAAAAAGPRPVVPLPKTATPPAQSLNRAPAPAPASAPAAAPAAAAAPTAAAAAPAAASAQPSAPAEAPAKDATGWQTAGADSKRHNRPQSISATPTEKEGTLGYVKYVTEKVQEADLRNALAAHGELAYFDINRQKNCAFVEYKTIEGYNAALNSNPHTVNGEQIIVEQRRPKTTAQGPNNFGRGGSQRGRGGFDGPRSGGNNRGNMGGNRGRGAPRGRGGSQATNA